jgi:hypothetical protein
MHDFALKCYREHFPLRKRVIWPRFRWRPPGRILFAVVAPKAQGTKTDLVPRRIGSRFFIFGPHIYPFLTARSL